MRSLEMLLEMRPDSVPVQFPGVVPGTPWWNDPERYGFSFDAEEMTRVGLDYKIKLLFPPSMWEEPPYSPGRQAVPGVHAGHDEVRGRAGAGGDPDGGARRQRADRGVRGDAAARVPRRQSRVWCTIGDAEAMGQMVARANTKASSAVAAHQTSAAARPPPPG
jgi:hypothetical protein